MYIPDHKKYRFLLFLSLRENKIRNKTIDLVLYKKKPMGVQVDLISVLVDIRADPYMFNNTHCNYEDAV